MIPLLWTSPCIVEVELAQPHTGVSGALDGVRAPALLFAPIPLEP